MMTYLERNQMTWEKELPKACTSNAEQWVARAQHLAESLGNHTGWGRIFLRRHRPGPPGPKEWVYRVAQLGSRFFVHPPLGAGGRGGCRCAKIRLRKASRA